MLVVRHGESTWNVEDRWTGQADPPLTTTGEAATIRLAQELGGLGFRAIATSDLGRAVQSAEALASALHLPAPRRIVGLRERDMGLWTGKTNDEIDREWPGWRERWRQDELLELPGGESRDAFDARVRSALVEVAGDTRPDDRLLVLGHAGTLRTLDRHLGGVSRRGNLARVWVVVEGSSISGAG